MKRKTKNAIIMLGDALKCMEKIKTNSINLIAVDLPYGTTNNKWDAVIPFKPMWDNFKNANTL